MTYLYCIVELGDLVKEGLHWLEYQFFAFSMDFRDQIAIIVLGSLHTREEIIDNVLEEW